MWLIAMRKVSSRSRAALIVVHLDTSSSTQRSSPSNCACSGGSSLDIASSSKAARDHDGVTSWMAKMSG
jgi:hypothetical protein